MPNPEAPTDIVGRNKLVLKAENCDELVYYTTDDEQNAIRLYGYDEAVVQRDKGSPRGYAP